MEIINASLALGVRMSALVVSLAAVRAFLDDGIFNAVQAVELSILNWNNTGGAVKEPKGGRYGTRISYRRTRMPKLAWVRLGVGLG